MKLTRGLWKRTKCRLFVGLRSTHSRPGPTFLCRKPKCSVPGKRYCKKNMKRRARWVGTNVVATTFKGRDTCCRICHFQSTLRFNPFQMTQRNYSEESRRKKKEDNGKRTKKDKESTTSQRASNKHIPVLLDEVIAAIEPRSNCVYVDATFGRGGHTSAILGNLMLCFSK